MVSSEEIRELFLSFFEKRGHKKINSSPLILEDDPSILFVTAGMQQFKKYFTHEKDAKKDFGTQRITTIQKCFRTTDLDEIGDNRHLTFFEMLGNFSFGPVGNDDPNDFGNDGYFKRSTIYWAYEFLKSLGINIQYVSVFKGEKGINFDEESYNTWKELGFNEDKIKKFGAEDNFWGPTGDEGPCGPTTEIYIDNIEVWNLVFNEYYQDKNKKLKKLEFPGVDTGMGFERLMKVLQNKNSIFETDLFEPLRTNILEINSNLEERDLRIILDHLRAIVFLIGEGVFPSNLERGYVLRRILRRLMLKLDKYKLEKYLDKFVQAVSIKFSKIYKELENYDKILLVAKKEFENFGRTLNKGLRVFDRIIKGNEEGEEIARKVFLLYTSYGLPLDITKEILKERGRNLREDEIKIFEDLFKQHQKISKNIK
ncbi:MAG: alanine--tRNA ligase-related protein [Minisyncoccia bacterium]